MRKDERKKKFDFQAQFFENFVLDSVLCVGAAVGAEGEKDEKKIKDVICCE